MLATGVIMKKLIARTSGKMCNKCREPIFIGFMYIPLRRKKYLHADCLVKKEVKPVTFMQKLLLKIAK